MTLEEIDNLLLEDVRTEITQRVLAKYATELDGHPELMDELIDNEFSVYKQELRVAEEARLAEEAEAQAEADRIAREAAEEAARQQAEADAAKREELENRVGAIDSISECYYALHSEPNMKLWLRNNIYTNQDLADAEAKVVALESKRTEIDNSIEKKKIEWEKNLRKSLAQNKITTDGLVEALVRHVILGDTSRSDALKQALIDIDQANPRPQEP